MSYITKEEFTTHVYEENQQVISRGDDTKVDTALSAAISEATGYLSRFDTDSLFAATAENRDPILIMYLKDIAKWHFFNISNAGGDIELAKERYDMAIKWLDKVQSGRVTPKGWPYPEGDNLPVPSFIISSRPKRGNYY